MHSVAAKLPPELLKRELDAQAKAQSERLMRANDKIDQRRRQHRSSVKAMRSTFAESIQRRDEERKQGLEQQKRDLTSEVGVARARRSSMEQVHEEAEGDLQLGASGAVGWEMRGKTSSPDGDAAVPAAAPQPMGGVKSVASKFAGAPAAAVPEPPPAPPSPTKRPPATAKMSEHAKEVDRRAKAWLADYKPETTSEFEARILEGRSLSAPKAAP